MTLKYFLSGFFVKAVTGFDDTMVHIPIVANLTKTRFGRIAFCAGILFAIILAIFVSILFASVIKLIPYFKYIASGLIFFIALSIYFNWFFQKPKEEIKKKVKKISTKRLFKLLGIGFITAFATVIDDTIAYSSLFLGHSANMPYAILGILVATAFELTAIVYFSKKIMKFKWKKEITVIGLIIIGILILLGFL